MASSKDSLANIFKLLGEKHAREFNFLPKTFCLPKEMEGLKEYMKENSGKTVICKPADGAEG